MTDTIHPAAARGFDAGADIYERARPDYPSDAVAAIVDRLDLRPGARSSSSARAPASSPGCSSRRGAGSSPRARRRDAGEARAHRGRRRDGRVVDGTAEAIPLPAASVDAVVVAQAFHWFDAIRALSEIHRVLRPGGASCSPGTSATSPCPGCARMGDRIRTLAGDEPQVWDDEMAGRRSAGARCSSRGRPRRSGTSRRCTPRGRPRPCRLGELRGGGEPSAQAEVLAEVEARSSATDPDTAGREVIELPYDTEVMWATGARSSPASTASWRRST